MARRESPLPLGLLHCLPAGLLGQSRRPVQRVPNRLHCTTPNLGDYPFGADLFLVGRFQRVQQCPLSVAKVAVGWIVSDGLEFRAEGAGIGRFPQRGQRLGRFLKIYGLSVVADHQLAVGPF